MIGEIEKLNKVKKLLKKCLTNREESGRISKLSQRTADIDLKPESKIFLKKFRKRY